VLVELGRRFREAEAASAPSYRAWRPRTVVVLVILTLIACAAVAAATGLIHIGSPVSAPPPGDVVPAQIPVPETATVEAVTSPDPDGGPAWGIRVARNSAGEPCFAVNRVLDGKLGIVTGTEFRELPIRGPGSCGPAPDPVRYEVTLASGRETGGGRTAVAGLVSADVASVTVNGPDGPRKLEISPHGAFVTVFRGVLTPREVPVTAQLEDGSERRYDAPG
jgi:hypothetical protein